MKTGVVLQQLTLANYLLNGEKMKVSFNLVKKISQTEYLCEIFKDDVICILDGFKNHLLVTRTKEVGESTNRSFEENGLQELAEYFVNVHGF